MFTQTLSNFIVDAAYKDLTQDVTAMAKRGVFDYIAVALIGSREPVVDKVNHFIEETKSCDESTVIGSKIKASANLAALANGTMGHALDYDDVIHVSPMWMGHPSTVVLPAVLAVAEKENVSGQELLLAYILGVECYAKVALFCGDHAYQNGWHNTSIMGTIAAAGAAAKLLRLNLPEVRKSIGIAASLACGLRQNFGTMTKPLHAGVAARNGVEAALLAKYGLTASENILEARLGFRSVFGHIYNENGQNILYGDKSISEAELADRLGNPWNILKPGLSVKICPSCRATHFGMEAALQFREKHPVEIDQIMEIECHVPQHMASVLFYHNPQKGLEGKFSLEYVLARTMFSGIPKIADFTDSRVGEPDIKKLIDKMKWISFDPQPGTFGTPVFIFKSAKGTVFRAEIEFPRGEPENPVEEGTIVEKFKDCAGQVLSDEVISQIGGVLKDIENIDEISKLTRLLSG